MAAQDPTTSSSVSAPSSTEIWKPIVGYEGLYEVSTCGRVQSLDRLAKHYKSGRQKIKGRMLRLRSKGKGRHARYKHVALWKDGKRSDRPVYQLVLETFVGPRPYKYICNHIDGNPENNCVENLEWVTYKRNAQHAVEIGTMVNHCGERNGMSRFKDEDIVEIRRLASLGMRHSHIGRMFNAPCATISRIVYKKIWKHI